MRKIRRELELLRFDIQRERATVNAIKRQLKRCYGKEVKGGYYVDPERDIQRIREEAFADPYDEIDLENARQFFQASLDEKRKRAAYLKEELESQFPLTPCALYRMLKKGSG